MINIPNIKPSHNSYSRKCLIFYVEGTYTVYCTLMNDHSFSTTFLFCRYNRGTFLSLLAFSWWLEMRILLYKHSCESAYNETQKHKTNLRVSLRQQIVALMVPALNTHSTHLKPHFILTTTTPFSF